MSRRLLPDEQLVHGDAERLGDCGQPRLIGAGDPVLPVRDGGFVNADRVSEVFLSQPPHLTQRRDSPVDGSAETIARLPLSFHASVVDQRSTFVNLKLTTDSPPNAQRFGCMGDARHKKAPAGDEEEEDVTDDFRRAASDALKINDQRNRLSGLKKGDAGYLISNRAELADAIGTDKTMVNKIIGPAKPDTQVKLVDRSTFVGRIRAALQLPAVTKLMVKTARLGIVAFIAELPDDKFQVFEKEVQRIWRGATKTATRQSG